MSSTAFTIWLTGLSGSGKSTIATNVYRMLVDKKMSCILLDADLLRLGINSDLKFSRADKYENVRRISEVAKIVNEIGVHAIVACISPYGQDRAMAERIIGDSRFIEVFCSADVSVCEARDTKGVYKSARQGKFSDFSGISSPYEIPEHPDLILNTERDTLDECLDRLFKHISKFQLMGPKI